MDGLGINTLKGENSLRKMRFYHLHVVPASKGKELRGWDLGI
jgi:hypothetical protein